jgi:hypothetical protein
MRIALFLALAMIALRLGLHFGGVELEGLTFGFILMGAVTLLAFVSGAMHLRDEPNAPVPSLFKAGLRDTALFALLCAVGLYAFNRFINYEEFQMQVNGIIRDSVAGGIPEAEAREVAERTFTPGWQAFLSFAGLLALGAVYSLFFAFVQHKLLRKLRR